MFNFELGTSLQSTK